MDFYVSIKFRVEEHIKELRSENRKPLTVKTFRTATETGILI